MDNASGLRSSRRFTGNFMTDAFGNDSNEVNCRNYNAKNVDKWWSGSLDNNVYQLKNPVKVQKKGTFHTKTPSLVTSAKIVSQL